MLDAAYWNDLYLKGDTGWDKGAPSPPIARMLAEGVVPAGAAIAVIGAGRGHDALEAQRLGYRVTAIDFAPEAAKGGVLFGLFSAHGREGGPPFDTSEAEVRRLFEARFTIERLRVAPDSFEVRKGVELEAVFRAKASRSR
jgi:hypothetical protein